MPRMPSYSKHRIVARGKGPAGRVISFDMEKGIGSYWGDVSPAKSFVRYMRPSRFLELAFPMGEKEPFGYIPKQLSKGRGEWAPLSEAPSLDKRWKYNKLGWKPNTMKPFVLEVRDDQNIEALGVVGHEGRHRARYLSRRGDSKVPVLIIGNSRLSTLATRRPIVPQKIYQRYLTSHQYGSESKAKAQEQILRDFLAGKK